jgi:hypothetical protein
MRDTEPSPLLLLSQSKEFPVVVGCQQLGRPSREKYRSIRKNIRKGSGREARNLGETVPYTIPTLSGEKKKESKEPQIIT